MLNQLGNSQRCRALSTKDKVVLDIRRGSDGTQLTMRVVRGRLPVLVLIASLTALIAMALASRGPLRYASADIAVHISRGGDGDGERDAPGRGIWLALLRGRSRRGRAGDAVLMTRELTAGQGRALATGLLMLAASAGAVWELFQVTSESVFVLAGGVGYILESVRRCGVRRRRFLDAQDVSYVALSETITSTDVRFFLAFVPRAAKPDNTTPATCSPYDLGGEDDGGSSGQLAVPYENLLPRMRLSHLTAIYSELVGQTQRQSGAPESS
ncbi:hypothetical protein VaNZ11_004056 [Volvox africanus]|uniref:GPI-GlcNAc transferase complex PIG-H component conserved domain-containing protein n=1 Tax=Volvox africanus TaxID=51714 RepID=A0ABQ5RVI2_9CHLO|nr:hypothetical protein VaNZ11_004056 [Volvox africanus]